MPNPGQKSVSIPTELHEAIQEVIAEFPMFKNVGHFIRGAIEDRIMQARAARPLDA